MPINAFPIPSRRSHGSYISTSETGELQYSLSPSTSCGSPGNTSDNLETPPLNELRHERAYGEPLIVTVPFTDKQTPANQQRAFPETTSFEELKHAEGGIPEWDDSDVDEIMVLSSAEKRLSIIAEGSESMSESEIAAKTSDVAMDVSDFCCVHRMRTGVNDTGVVYLGRRKDTTILYAVKIVQKSGLGPTTQRCIQREQAALRVLTERGALFVPRLWSSFQDSNALYLITNVCPGVRLRARVEKDGIVIQELALFYAAELVKAIGTLHACGVIHEALSPDTILIGMDGHILLTGFEKSTVVGVEPYGNDASGTTVDAFQAPEIILGWPHDCAVDWWGFGAVLYFILTGQHPFLQGQDVEQLHPKILEGYILYGKINLDAIPLLDCGVLDLITHCLSRNPTLRLGWAGVRRHTYFADIYWEQIGLDKAPLLPDLNRFATRDKYHCYDKHLYADDADGSNLASHGNIKQEVDASNFTFTWNADGSPGHSNTQREAANASTSLAPASPGITIVAPDVEIKRNSKTYDQTLDTSVMSMDLSGHQSDLIKVRSGTLRKYASLNFDLDTLASAPLHEDESTPVSNTILPFRYNQFGSPMSMNESPKSRKKLRKKVRPESSVPLVIQASPPLDLPAGIKQIGNGIGYTRRAEPQYPRLSMSTLTPRTCHALFAGSRLPYFKQDPGKTGSKHRLDGIPSPVMHGINASEDQMDAIMREMYGSTWALGLSSTDVSAAAAAAAAAASGPKLKARTGLGWNDSALVFPERPRDAAPPAELSTMSPDSTLRLVTPSTPNLES